MFDKQQSFDAGKQLGKQAFIDGEKRVPAWSKKLIKLVETGEYETLGLLEGWLKGWDVENTSTDNF